MNDSHNNSKIPRVDLDSLPEYKKRTLADMALDLTRVCFEIPCMEERYRKWLIDYRARKRAAKKERSDSNATLLDAP